MGRTIVAFVCGWCVMAFLLPATAEENNRGESAIDEHIEEFSGMRFIFVPFLTRESFQLALKMGEEKLQYSPNVQWRYGAGVSVYNFALYYIANIPGDNMMQDEETHGKSNGLDILVHYYIRNFGIDFAFQRYEGFYLDEQDPSKASGVRYLFPDMRSMNFGVNFYYLLSGDRYSMSAAYDQRERQLKSGGSFVIMASLHYFTIKNDGSIIPLPYSTQAADVAGFEGGRFFTASVGPGYGYTVVMSKFFISPAFFFGTGGQYRDYTVATGDEQNFRVPLKINWRMILGYNGDNVIAGFRFLVDFTMVGLQDAQLQAYTLEGTIFAGMRF